MPTGRVVAGFGSLSKDNRLILTMDRVAEGFTLVLLGVLVAVVTMRGGSADPVTQAVYAVAAGALRGRLGGPPLLRLRRGRLSAVTHRRGVRACSYSAAHHARQTGHSVTLPGPRGPITHSPFGDPAARVHQEGGVEHPWPPCSGFG